MLRAGIGSKATAQFVDGAVVVSAPPGEIAPAPAAPTEALAAPADSAETVVRVSGLVKRYGETLVLDELDAAFAPGRLHAVTGPSGSGKTTFLHLLAGLELPDAGSVVLDGEDLTTLDRTGRSALRRAKIAYVGQQAGLIPHLSALENVELALALRGRPDDRLAALGALESVGLAERATQRIARLSQGERARAAIARAIAAKPLLLLADEPTSRLDGANAIAVAILLSRLARDTGAAVVCSTHDPLVIEQADDELKL